jgi:hypothetical protein
VDGRGGGGKAQSRPLLRLALVATIAAVVLGGCGNERVAVGTSPPASPGVATTHAVATPAPIEPGGPLHEVGTMTETDGKGTAVHLQYQLGALGYSPAVVAPPAVLETCHEDYSTTIAQMGYSRGQLSVSYTEGSLPTEVALGANGAVSGTSTATKWSGSVAYDVEGEWKCPANEEAGTSVTFQPGETKTFPLWVLSAGLDNAQPRFTPTVIDGWEFTGVTIGNSPLEVTASGPNAGRCDNKDVLMLYAKLPFSIEVEGYVGSSPRVVGCERVG